MSTENPTTENTAHRALDCLERIIKAHADGRLDDEDWSEFMDAVERINARVDREARPA